MKNKRLIALISILLLAVASYVLGWSTLLTVRGIEVTGTSANLTSQVFKGEKLARVEPRTVAASYQKYDFIESAQVSRNWLTGKVTIAITERTPIAIYNGAAIDKQGKAFVPHSGAEKNLPLISAATTADAITAVNFFKTLPPEITSQLTLLKMLSGQAYQLSIDLGDRKLQLRWGTATENALKVKVYKALMAQPENAKIRRMDLSAPHAPIVK